MAQVRLNNYTRESIANNAIREAFKQREEDLATAEDALAREVHAQLFTATEIRLANELPRNWLRRENSLEFSVDGLRMRLFTKTDHLPTPFRSKMSAISLQGNIPRGDLADRVLTLVKTKEDLGRAKAKSRQDLLALLGATSTLKKLKEEWPEGAPHYSMYETAPAAPLPAVRFEDINATLGLSK